MSQAWHDCLHTSPKWKPVATSPANQSWRLGVYLMRNNPDRLLEAVREDFPEIDTRHENMIPVD